MHIGYFHLFDTSAIDSGGAVHVYNLTREWTDMGATVHALDPENNRSCIVYPRTKEGIKLFVDAIDVLYIRIDGSPVRHGPFRKLAMTLATELSVPIVWEINAPEEEKLIQARQRRAPRKQRASWAWPKRMRKTLGYWNLLRILYHDRFMERRERMGWGSSVAAATCVSEALVPYARELDISSVTVVPNGSDPDLFSPSRAESDVLGQAQGVEMKVVFSGDISYPWQGFQTIVDVAWRTWENDLPISFHILSHTQDTPKASPPNLYIEGRVPYQKVAAYLAAADVCLCVYQTEGWSRYGFHNSPLKLYDYMAVGKPIIASRMGQIEHVLTDGVDGFLTDGTPQEIYHPLIDCLNRPEKARRMGKAARRKLIQQYTWKHAALKTLDVFQRTLQAVPST